MPRRVHSAEIIVTISSCNQSADFAVGSIEVRQGIQSRDNCRDRSRDHRYQKFALHIRWSLRRILCVLLLLIMVRDRSLRRVRLHVG